ncbi:hypothetical protein WJX84_004715 [Apatococcus fuscideae]|uniref:DUF1206 domain-containing protein n=1 Tax=Apatococcus fuscideae TaxID=2026836 RepID=A0AAW1T661_9CHLO
MLKYWLKWHGVVQLSRRQHLLIVVTGRIGWVAKAIVYAVIGGVSCESAVQGYASGAAFASPQGAFIFIGNGFLGIPALITIAVMLAMYSVWRFVEGSLGVGTDPATAAWKNFFRYRLSPSVSGAVYSAYFVFVVYLLSKNKQQRLEAQHGHAFPNSWRGSATGSLGLIFLGTAFLAATGSQLENTFSSGWHWELESDLHRMLLWATLISGHIGFAARSATFLAVAILFFRTIATNTGSDTAVANAMYQLQGSVSHRIILFLLGLGLIIYGLFATLCGVYTRTFPTKPRCDGSAQSQILPESRSPPGVGAMGAEWLRKQLSKPSTSMQV